ncbi:helix-turn-helix transcriptional regulator [Peribacillus sp. NPDC076916]|uniref:helix-turn-helix transcriptional regulator n=1 Tax=Peribacillus TaxID=2675229 RepID=UPI003D073D47
MIKSRIGDVIKKSPYNRRYIRSYMGDISDNTLSNWCTGKAYPKAPDLFKLAKLLGVKVDDLYEEDEE